VTPEEEDLLLETVRAELDAAYDSETDRPRPHPVCWHALPGDVAAEEWRDLRRWVGWLVSRYSLDHRAVPPCWYRHAALVEELSALHCLWQTCFTHGAAASDPVAFHEHLALGLTRLREWAARRGCKPGLHRDDQPQCGRTPTPISSTTWPATRTARPPAVEHTWRQHRAHTTAETRPGAGPTN
jgi:hypothetical protein